MGSAYANDPLCRDCGKKKGPNQLKNARCFRCGKIATRKQRGERHGNHVEKTFGITGAMYGRLRAYQAGTCAICARATGASKRLAVDHNHACSMGHPPQVGCIECVRGLLCSTCNTFIGRVRDDPRVGERMARYLRDPPFQMMRANLEAPRYGAET